MSESKSYNGYENYETWCAALWINNDEYYQSMAHNIVKQYGDTRQAEEALRDFVEAGSPDLGGTMYGDMLNAALQEIDYRELVSTFAEDIEEEDTED
jgi:hypothetical protein